jgi:hypothetical protein
LFLTVRQDPADPGSLFVATLQKGQGLAVDGGRTYAEHTVEWVSWYTGWVALAAAWVVLAVLVGAAVRWWCAPGDLAPHVVATGAQGRPTARSTPPWIVPVLVGLGSTALVLYRPGITPDHPWADRRLVPVVLPVVVLAATAAAAWLTRRARRRAPAWLLVLTVVGSVAALVVPPVLATAPMATQRTEVGEPGAVDAVCANLAPTDVVATVDATASGIGQRSANEWVQVVRGVCDRPSAALLTPSAQLPEAVRRLAGLVRAAGGRLVLLTAQEDDDAALRVLTTALGRPADEVAAAATGANPVGARRAVQLVTTEDRKLLTRRPAGAARLVVDVWTVAVPEPG